MQIALTPRKQRRNTPWCPLLLALGASACSAVPHKQRWLWACHKQGVMFPFQLQYLVPRLSLEARGVLCEEAKAALSWSSLSCPSLNYRRASLCLWKQARFQELLKEKAFQVQIFSIAQIHPLILTFLDLPFAISLLAIKSFL